MHINKQDCTGKKSEINVILDRDGTVIVDKHYLSKPKDVELLPRAGQALCQLSKANAKLFIATNQSGIGRGYFNLSDYKACEQMLDSILQSYGVNIAYTAFCPHAPENACECRKPKTGMWQEIESKFKIKPNRTVMIGDKLADLNLGINAGLALSILVLSGKGLSEAKKQNWPLPEENNSIVLEKNAETTTLISYDLPSAANFICEYFKLSCLPLG